MIPIICVRPFSKENHRERKGFWEIHGNPILSVFLILAFLESLFFPYPSLSFSTIPFLFGIPTVSFRIYFCLEIMYFLEALSRASPIFFLLGFLSFPMKSFWGSLPFLMFPGLGLSLLDLSMSCRSLPEIPDFYVSFCGIHILSLLGNHGLPIVHHLRLLGIPIFHYLSFWNPYVFSRFANPCCDPCLSHHPFDL